MPHPVVGPAAVWARQADPASAESSFQQQPSLSDAAGAAFITGAGKHVAQRCFQRRFSFTAQRSLEEAGCGRRACNGGRRKPPARGESQTPTARLGPVRLQSCSRRQRWEKGAEQWKGNKEQTREKSETEGTMKKGHCPTPQELAVIRTRALFSHNSPSCPSLAMERRAENPQLAISHPGGIRHPLRDSRGGGREGFLALLGWEWSCKGKKPPTLGGPRGLAWGDGLAGLA